MAVVQNCPHQVLFLVFMESIPMIKWEYWGKDKNRDLAWRVFSDSCCGWPWQRGPHYADLEAILVFRVCQKQVFLHIVGTWTNSQPNPAFPDRTVLKTHTEHGACLESLQTCLRCYCWKLNRIKHFGEGETNRSWFTLLSTGQKRKTHK